MFCIACGRQMSEADKFCSQCGTRRAVIPSDAVVASPPPPPSDARPEKPAPAPQRTIRSTAEIMPIRMQRASIPPPPVQEVDEVVPEEPEVAQSAVPWPMEEERAPRFAAQEPTPVMPPEPVRQAAPPVSEPVPLRQAHPPAAERYAGVPFAAPVDSHEVGHERRKISPVLIGALLVALIALAGIVWMLRSSMSGAGGAAAKVEISIFPTTAKMAAGKSADFKANLTAPPTDQVTWKVDEGDAGGQVQVQRGSEGANSQYSTYTAPKTPGTYHLVASSTVDPTKSATAAITVTAK